MKVTSRKGAVLQEHVELEHTASWYTLVFLLGLATLHFMDCIRKIFSGNSATQTITSITRIQMIQLGLPQTMHFFLLSL